MLYTQFVIFGCFVRYEMIAHVIVLSIYSSLYRTDKVAVHCKHKERIDEYNQRSFCLTLSFQRLSAIVSIYDTRQIKTCVCSGFREHILFSSVEICIKLRSDASFLVPCEQCCCFHRTTKN